jgi:hypothetical protein
MATSNTLKTFNGFEVIEASDTYYCELNGWQPVPNFWIGDLVGLKSFQIKDRMGRTKSTKHTRAEKQ